MFIHIVMTLTVAFSILSSAYETETDVSYILLLSVILLQDIEPGLEQSETFYSITYVVLFAGYSVSAVSVGFLFNHMPTWHLLFVSTLCHTIGYLIYALAMNGWMMIVARALAGLQLGAVESLVFYYSLSFMKYTENLKKKAHRAKGYLFSTSNLGSILGYAFGSG